jgi:hypothetical protein
MELSDKKYNTVREIFDVYLPRTVRLPVREVCPEEIEFEDKLNIGTELAARLVEEFRVGLQEQRDLKEKGEGK